MTMPILVEVAEGVATISLNRPAQYNALDVVAAGKLHEALTGVAADSTVKAVIITGVGKAFCAGGDLRWVASHPGGLPTAFLELTAQWHAAVTEIHRMPKPVIAALNGVAAGGGFSLALACDFRVMSSSAHLRQGYSSAGLSMDASGSFMLPRLVGLARALEIATFDQPIDASTALAWGLVTRVVESDQLAAAALELARSIMRGSLSSFAAMKALLRGSMDHTLETQLDLERAAIVECAEGEDAREGISAFVERRAAKFGSG